MTKFNFGSVINTAVVASTLLTQTAKGLSFNYDNQYVINRQYSLSNLQPVALTSALWEQVPLLSAAPQVFPNLPSACTCINEEQTSAECSSFICNQTCNLNIGQCDENCCSDPDCSPADIEKFQGAGTCVIEARSGVQMKCEDLTTLEAVNAKYNMFVEKDNDPLAGFLCVAVYNTPYEGEFYDPKASLINNVAMLNDPLYRPAYSFQKDRSRFKSATGMYTSGNPIVAAITRNNTLNWAWGGFLSLPTAGVDGTCSDSNFVKFGQNVQENSCLREIPDLEAMCSDKYGPLTVNWIVDLLSIGANPWVSLSDKSTGTWVPVISKTTQVSELNGEKVPLPQGQSNLTYWSSSDKQCINALRQVHFNIAYETDGTISSVSVEFIVSNLSPSTDLAVMQNFHVSFSNANSVVASTPVVQRTVSGNPGYIQGLPVQAGNSTSINANTVDEKVAVQYFPEGLTLHAPAGPRGECLTSKIEMDTFVEAMQTQRTSSTPVLFGMDTVSTCTVKLTYDDFKSISTWCRDFSAFSMFQLDASIVGIYGNSDPLKSWEWVPLSASTSGLLTTKQSPTPGTLTCNNVVDRMDIEILWMNSGDISHPQPMIVAARAVLKQSDWSWRRSFASGLQQTFTFTQSVTFIQANNTEETHNYKPDIAPIIPQLPSDIFYPFDIVSNTVRPTPVLSIFGALVIGFLRYEN